jgi:hypothetical protein
MVCHSSPAAHPVKLRRIVARPGEGLDSSCPPRSMSGEEGLDDQGEDAGDDDTVHPLQQGRSEP